MLFVIDGSISIEIIYNEKEETYIRKIRKDGMVVEMSVIDKVLAKNYFSDAELELFQREYDKYKEKKDAQEA